MKIRGYRLIVLAGLFVCGLGSASQAYEPSSHYQLWNVEDWQVYIHKDLLPGGEHEQTGAQAIAKLQYGLAKMRQMVAEPALGKMMAVKIWLEVNSTRGKHGRTAAYQYHPGLAWLVKMDFHPGKVKCVEYGNAASLAKRSELKAVDVTVHELAHAFHDLVLGFEDEDVIAAHNRARTQGKYPDKDWVVRTNHKEFFAGLTQRYFRSEDERKTLAERDPVFAGKLEEYYDQPKAYMDTPIDMEKRDKPFPIDAALKDTRQTTRGSDRPTPTPDR